MRSAVLHRCGPHPARPGGCTEAPPFAVMGRLFSEPLSFLQKMVGAGQMRGRCVADAWQMHARMHAQRRGRCMVEAWQMHM